MPTESWSSNASWTVPDKVQEVEVDLRGAAGNTSFDSDDSPGDGGRVQGILDVTPGETLYIRFSKDGEFTRYNEAVDIRQGGSSLSDRVVVAGGGGDVGSDEDGDGNETYYTNTPGGDGGGLEGQPGYAGPPDDPQQIAIYGGSQTSGGSSSEFDLNGATSGSGPDGGEGGYYSGNGGVGGGNGGDGYYGGGGGGATSQGGAGGGGGSSYVDGLKTVTSNEQGGGSTGQEGIVEITYQVPPDAPTNLSVTSYDANSVSLDWDGNTDADGYRLYRAASAGVTTSDTQVANTAETSNTDNSVLNGWTYHYAVVAYNDAGDSPFSNEVSVTTTLPAPTGLSVSNVGDATADLAWTANHTNGDTRVEIRPDGDASWDVYQTIGYSTESMSLTGLLNGQLYDVRVVADTNDAEEVDQ